MRLEYIGTGDRALFNEDRHLLRYLYGYLVKTKPPLTLWLQDQGLVEAGVEDDAMWTLLFNGWVVFFTSDSRAPAAHIDTSETNYFRSSVDQPSSGFDQRGRLVFYTDSIRNDADAMKIPLHFAMELLCLHEMTHAILKTTEAAGAVGANPGLWIGSTPRSREIHEALALYVVSHVGPRFLLSEPTKNRVPLVRRYLQHVEAEDNKRKYKEDPRTGNGYLTSYLPFFMNRTAEVKPRELRAHLSKNYPEFFVYPQAVELA